MTRNIIFSGAAVYTPYVESKIMAKYAVAMGVPPQNVFVECEAEHSTENIYNSYALAQQLGFKKIALATDPFQIFMLKLFMGRQYLQMALLRIKYYIVHWFAGENPPVKINPADAMIADFVPLPERKDPGKDSKEP